MTLASWLWTVVSWLSMPVMALVLGMLLWRRLHRVFPLFFCFLVVTEIVGILRLITAQFGSRQAYYYVYWISDLVLMIFTFLPIYELFVMRLFPRFYKIGVYRYLFAAAASSIIVATWITGFASPNRKVWLKLEARVLGFAAVAILIFFVSLMMVMGRLWTRYDFGIASGFAINNAAVLATSAVWVRARYRPTIVDQLPLIAFDISCLIWLITFWKPERPTEPPLGDHVDSAMVTQARSWEALLKSWLIPGKSKR